MTVLRFVVETPPNFCPAKNIHLHGKLQPFGAFYSSLQLVSLNQHF